MVIMIKANPVDFKPLRSQPDERPTTSGVFEKYSLFKVLSGSRLETIVNREP